jgi:hypothetical protein
MIGEIVTGVKVQSQRHGEVYGLNDNQEAGSQAVVAQHLATVGMSVYRRRGGAAKQI